MEGCVFDYGDNRHADAFITHKKTFEEHLGSSYEHGADVRASIQNGVKLVIPLPVAPVNPPDASGNVAPLTDMQKMILSTLVTSYGKRVAKLDENLKKAFSKALSLCTETLKSKLEQHGTWVGIFADFDVLRLFTLMQSVIFKYEDRKFQPLSLLKTKMTFFSFRQGNLSNADYLKKFKNRLDVLTSHGTTIAEKAVAMGIMKLNPTDANKSFEHDDNNACLTEAEREDYYKRAEDMSHAIAFLLQADPRRYGELLMDLENDFTKSRGSYPVTLVKAYEYLNEYKIKSVVHTGDGQEHNVAFTQNKDKKSSQQFEPWMKNKICHNCSKEGHISPVCPNKEQVDSDTERAESDTEQEDTDEDSEPKMKKSSGGKKASDKGENKEKKSTKKSKNGITKQVGFAQREHDESDSEESMFCNIVTTSTVLVTAESSTSNLRDMWLLDNQSTTDLFCNEKFVTNIHKVKGKISVQTNGGLLTTNLRAHVEGYGDVWFSANAITNILSIKNVTKKFRVMYDSAKDNGSFIVHLPNRMMFFIKNRDGLHYYDPTRRGESSLIQIMEENEVGHSQLVGKDDSNDAVSMTSANSNEHEIVDESLHDEPADAVDNRIPGVDHQIPGVGHAETPGVNIDNTASTAEQIDDYQQLPREHDENEDNNEHGEPTIEQDDPNESGDAENSNDDAENSNDDDSAGDDTIQHREQQKYQELTMVTDLESFGFALDPSDPCVANKIIAGSEMTLCWDVDNVKISHKEPKVGMVQYIKDMVKDFGQYDSDPKKTVVTPAGKHLYKVRDDATKLPEQKANIFHNFVARGLFATKKSRPDIHTAISFLTTRVKEPDEDDWKKLQRMIRYLRGTTEICLTLSGDETSVIVEHVRWWIDSSHAMHENMQGRMVADFFTKPLQGSLFRKFRNSIMNIKEA